MLIANEDEQVSPLCDKLGHALRVTHFKETFHIYVYFLSLFYYFS
jgi:hypothetical protein